MKRKNFKRILISCIVIWSVVIGSLLSYSPDTHVLSATGVPEITLTAPVGKSVFEVSKVDFTGRISDDLTTPEKLIMKVFEYTGTSDQPTDITGDGQLILTPKDQDATFSFSKDFSEGNHKLSFIVTDEDGFSSKLEQDFTVQLSGTEQKQESNTVTSVVQKAVVSQTATVSTQESTAVVRPYMAKLYLIPRGSEGEYQPGNVVPANYLPAEDMTRVPLEYIVLLDIRSSEPFDPTQPLITFFGDNTGKEKLVKTVDLPEGIKSYIYTFIPDQEKLDPAKSYSVYLNPNVLIPRFLKFTTVSNNYTSYQFEADKGNDVRADDSIHGPFSVVTNACNFCHSTHNGNNEFLEGGKYGPEGDDLCMACHDGTNGSPTLDTNYANNKHHASSGASCSTCHDPHNPGTKQNPNSFHQGSYNGISQLLAYKKASDATGAAGDFSLCLSCHNKGITNIEQYYKNDTFLGQSGHNIVATVDSGSALNGQLPCAECHETHGSKNIKMLRDNLGNVQLKDTEKFKTTSTNWIAEDERAFCLSCHNNSTEIYGKKGSFNTVNELGLPISGHQKVEDAKVYCSSCHGGASKTSIEAAHAPSRQ